MFKDVKTQLIQDIKDIYNTTSVLEVFIDIETERVCYIYLDIETIRADRIGNNLVKYYVIGKLSTRATSPCDRRKGFFIDTYLMKDINNQLPINTGLKLGLYETYNGENIEITFSYESKEFNFSDCNSGNITNINIDTTIVYD